MVSTTLNNGCTHVCMQALFRNSTSHPHPPAPTPFPSNAFKSCCALQRDGSATPYGVRPAGRIQGQPLRQGAAHPPRESLVSCEHSYSIGAMPYNKHMKPPIVRKVPCLAYFRDRLDREITVAVGRGQRVPSRTTETARRARTFCSMQVSNR